MTVAEAAGPIVGAGPADRRAGIGAGGADRTRARRDAITAFLVRCVSAALLYFTQVILARVMGANEYGVHVTVWSAILIIGGMTTLGLNLGVMRLVPVARAAGDFGRLGGIAVGGRLLAFGLGCAVAVVALAVVEGLAMSDQHRHAARIAVLCLPLFAIGDMQDGLGRGHGWILSALLPPYVLRPLLLLVVMGFAYLLGAPMVAVTAAMAAVAGVVIATAIQAVWMHSRFLEAHGGVKRIYEPRLWLASSLPLLAVAGAELVLQNADVMVLSRYAAPAEVAIYFAAAKTMSLMMFVHYAVGSAMASRFAALKERGDTAGLKAAVADAVAWTFWPSLLAGICILTAGKPILSLFGPGFTDAYPVMSILVVGLLLRSAMGPAEILLNMMGQQWACAAAMVTGAAAGLALNIVLVPIAGATGAACSTAAGLATVGLLNAWVAYRRLGIEVAIWRNARPRA